VKSPTYDELINEAVRRFREAGIDHPRSEAMMLMIHAFGGSHVALILAGDSCVPTMVEEVFLSAMERRAAREPAQHIMGETHFYGLDILTDARALIPRSDSECVVTAALDRLPKDGPFWLADLGTGSGCLLTALLVQRPEATGEGVEASPEAARLARANLEKHRLTDRSAIFIGSWEDWQGWGKADLIISNPPYIVSDVIGELEPEVRDYEPLMALDGGLDGLNCYREIIALGAAGMKPGAWLVLETGYDQKEAVLRLMTLAGFESLDSGQDLGGNDRWVAGCRPR
jgi:release factor glutamine methyltransferase